MPVLEATKVSRNAYEAALHNFDLAADKVRLEPDVREIIKYPERVLQVSLPVRLSDGHIHRFEGYRVQHSTARGPAKGGIRFHPNVNLEKSEGSRHLDDVEVRGGEYSLWGRQRRCGVQPQGYVE
jgi:hypothetical protein